MISIRKLLEKSKVLYDLNTVILYEGFVNKFIINSDWKQNKLILYYIILYYFILFYIILYYLQAFI